MRVKQCHKPAISECFIPPNTTYINGDLGDGVYISVYIWHMMLWYIIHGKDVPFFVGIDWWWVKLVECQDWVVERW